MDPKPSGCGAPSLGVVPTTGCFWIHSEARILEEPYWVDPQHCVVCGWSLEACQFPYYEPHYVHTMIPCQVILSGSEGRQLRPRVDPHFQHAFLPWASVSEAETLSLIAGRTDFVSSSALTCLCATHTHTQQVLPESLSMGPS